MVKEANAPYSTKMIRSPEMAAEIFQQFLAGADRENLVILCLDNKNKPTTIHTVSVGSLNSSVVHPREVFKVAILANSASIVLGHNHPSGDPEPSKEDVETTQRLMEAGRIIGIEVMDHVIVGDYGNYISLKEKGLIF